MNKNLFNKSIFKDIRFWIFLFAILRFYGITNPPLEIAHNWRQTTVTMVARNFIEIDANIFYPRIDIAGEKTGITGMEFPIFNYLIYLVSLIFGYQHWYGRLINLIVSSVGIYYFYKLVLKYFKPNIAFNAAFILIVSLWFSYSRKIMPDTFASSLIIISLYFGSNYLDRKSSLKNILLYVLFGLAGVLSKLPVGYIWILYLIPFLKTEIKLSTKLFFTLSSVLIFIPVYYWYFIWVPYLVEEYGFWHFFMGKPISQGVEEIITYWPKVLNHFYESAIRYVAMVFAVVGLVYAIVKKEKTLLYIFFLSLFAFMVIILKSGRTFAFHAYYVIPFVPILALLAAFGLDQIKNKKVVVLLLVLIGIEGLLNQWHDFILKPKNAALVALEEDFNKVSNGTDLIVVNSNEYPTPMYFTHRKGWLADNNKLADSTYLTDLKNHGCKYALILKKTFGSDINLNEKIVLENDNYTIYQLK